MKYRIRWENKNFANIGHLNPVWLFAHFQVKKKIEKKIEQGSKVVPSGRQGQEIFLLGK